MRAFIDQLHWSLFSSYKQLLVPKSVLIIPMITVKVAITDITEVIAGLNLFRLVKWPGLAKILRIYVTGFGCKQWLLCCGLWAFEVSKLCDNSCIYPRFKKSLTFVFEFWKSWKFSDFCFIRQWIPEACKNFVQHLRAHNFQQPLLFSF